MVTINNLNYELIIHNYSRLADKHKPAKLFPREEHRGGGKETLVQSLLPEAFTFIPLLPNQTWRRFTHFLG